MKKITALLLALLLVLTLGACGGDSNTGGGDDSTGGDSSVAVVYDVDDVKAKLVEIMAIDENEITMDDRDTGTVMSYGDWDIWFDSYFLNDPKDAPDMFDIQTWEDTAYDKRIDKKDHKIWVEESDSDSYTVIAMKGNFVISITSNVDPDTLIDALDLN